MNNSLNLSKENLAWAEEMFKKIDKKMSLMTIRSRNKVVDGTDENGVHKNRFEEGKPWFNKNWWCNGFWGGLNYMLYAYTKNEDYLKTAKTNEEMMDEALANYDRLDHDLGFLWHILSGASYTLTGDNASRTRNLFAASVLFSRFIPSGGFIRAWNFKDTEKKSIIDCLMNLPLLYWASRETKDDRFKQIAMAHADMALMDHIREDGSVVHIVAHNRETGEVEETFGGQGYEVGSSWSRGQSWAIYGYALSYLHTNEERYLDAAKKVANYFITNVSAANWLPVIDFRAPKEPVYYDSTAGAIAACGFIELAKILPEPEASVYLDAAVNILRAMGEKFMNFDDDNDCMLGYGSVRYPCDGDLVKAGVHISIIYGDYFYTEAVLKLLGAEFNPW